MVTGWEIGSKEEEGKEQLKDGLMFKPVAHIIFVHNMISCQHFELVAWGTLTLMGIYAILLNCL